MNKILVFAIIGGISLVIVGCKHPKPIISGSAVVAPGQVWVGEKKPTKAKPEELNNPANWAPPVAPYGQTDTAVLIPCP